MYEPQMALHQGAVKPSEILAKEPKLTVLHSLRSFPDWRVGIFASNTLAAIRQHLRDAPPPMWIEPGSSRVGGEQLLLQGERSLFACCSHPNSWSSGPGLLPKESSGFPYYLFSWNLLTLGVIWAYQAEAICLDGLCQQPLRDRSICPM